MRLSRHGWRGFWNSLLKRLGFSVSSKPGSVRRATRLHWPFLGSYLALPHHQRHRRLVFEQAEGRVMLTATWYSQYGLLIVQGATAAGTETIVVASVNVGGVDYVTVNGQQLNSDLGFSLAASAVQDLRVSGGSSFTYDGWDTIDLSAVSSAAFTSITTVTIYGNGGNDTLYGSQFADTIYGASLGQTWHDDDTIYGNGGDDVLLAGGSINNGQDILIGGAGNDTYRLTQPPSGSTGVFSAAITENSGEGTDTSGIRRLHHWNLN